MIRSPLPRLVSEEVTRGDALIQSDFVTYTCANIMIKIKIDEESY